MRIEIGINGVRVELFGKALAVERVGSGVWLEVGQTTVVIERVGYLPERGDRFFEREQCKARPGCYEAGFYLRGRHVHVSCEPRDYVGPMADWGNYFGGCPANG